MAKVDSSTKVLIVEDQMELAELYSEYLESEYEVITAHSGQQAIEALDVEPDVVLLDRRLPGMSGDELLDVIRESVDDARVGMVTGVDPDFDVLEMGFDEYLVKPIEEDDLRNTVERLHDTRDAGDKWLELSSKRVRRNVLEVEKTPAELKESDAYQRLEREINRLKEEVDAAEDEFDIQDDLTDATSRNWGEESLEGRPER